MAWYGNGLSATTGGRGQRGRGNRPKPRPQSNKRAAMQRKVAPRRGPARPSKAAKPAKKGASENYQDLIKETRTSVSDPMAQKAEVARFQRKAAQKKPAKKVAMERKTAPRRSSPPARSKAATGNKRLKEVKAQQAEVQRFAKKKMAMAKKLTPQLTESSPRPTAQKTIRAKQQTQQVDASIQRAIQKQRAKSNVPAKKLIPRKLIPRPDAEAQTAMKKRMEAQRAKVFKQESKVPAKKMVSPAPRGPDASIVKRIDEKRKEQTSRLKTMRKKMTPSGPDASILRRIDAKKSKNVPEEYDELIKKTGTKAPTQPSMRFDMQEAKRKMREAQTKRKAPSSSPDYADIVRKTGTSAMKTALEQRSEEISSMKKKMAKQKRRPRAMKKPKSFKVGDREVKVEQKGKQITVVEKKKGKIVSKKAVKTPAQAFKMQKAMSNKAVKEVPNAPSSTRAASTSWHLRWLSATNTEIEASSHVPDQSRSAERSTLAWRATPTSAAATVVK